jgi:phage recombination protein Bet
MAKQATAPAGQAVATLQTKSSLMAKFAAKFNVEPDKMLSALKATAFKVSGGGEVTNEQMLALIVVANQYGLNPFTKEIYAFPDQKGIVPVVSVDGWIRIINEHPQLQSIEFRYSDDTNENGAPAWIECSITRKDRGAPIVVREYLAECMRQTGPWKSHPSRMLRHKALIQAGRVAMGFAGIHDPDEAERIAAAIDVTPGGAKPKTEAPRARTEPAIESTASEVASDAAGDPAAEATFTDDEEAGARG